MTDANKLLGDYRNEIKEFEKTLMSAQVLMETLCTEKDVAFGVMLAKPDSTDGVLYGFHLSENDSLEIKDIIRLMIDRLDEEDQANLYEFLKEKFI